MMALIAKEARKAGFRGKICPSLEGEFGPQMIMYSAEYEDIFYSIRMEGPRPAVYVYRKEGETWMPVRKEGVINRYVDMLEYEETKEYSGYDDYFGYFGYDRFSPEWAIINRCVEESEGTGKKDDDIWL